MLKQSRVGAGRPCDRRVHGVWGPKTIWVVSTFNFLFGIINFLKPITNQFMRPWLIAEPSVERRHVSMFFFHSWRRHDPGTLPMRSRYSALSLRRGDANADTIRSSLGDRQKSSADNRHAMKTFSYKALNHYIFIWGNVIILSFCLHYSFVL